MLFVHYFVLVTENKEHFCCRVYCEYNSMSEHRFKTPEEQVLWFLSKAGKPGWKWMSLRPRSPLKDGPHNMKKTERDSYFCKSAIVSRITSNIPFCQWFMFLKMSYGI
jgi:hypothetical protein